MQCLYLWQFVELLDSNYCYYYRPHFSKDWICLSLNETITKLRIYSSCKYVEFAGIKKNKSISEYVKAWYAYIYNVIAVLSMDLSNLYHEKFKHLNPSKHNRKSYLLILVCICLKIATYNNFATTSKFHIILASIPHTAFMHIVASFVSSS